MATLILGLIDGIKILTEKILTDYAVNALVYFSKGEFMENQNNGPDFGNDNNGYNNWGPNNQTDTERQAQQQYGQQSQQQYGQQSQYQPPQYGQQGNYQQPPPTQPYNVPPAGVALKSKLVAGLLGIFLGSVGVHNFYLGYTGKAVAQLLIAVLTCGFGVTITSIWGLIEGIMILTGSISTDAQGLPLGD